MTKVEEVGKAIYESRNGAGCTPWGRQTAAHKSPYLSDALAALKAMREPSKAMLDAAYDAHDAYEAAPEPKAWCGLSSAFSAMIDAAIAEHQSAP